MKLKIFILLLCIPCLLTCGKSYPGKKQPSVQNGIIDLREWDFQKEGPVDLNGEWKFFWNNFVPPEKIDSEKSILIKVPTSWNNEVLNKKVIPGHGFATYSAKILIKHTNYPIALKFLTIGSAFDCYVNGKKIHRAGKIGKTKTSMVAAYNPSVVKIPGYKNEINITMHVSNFDQEYSGIWLPITIGDYKYLSNLRENNLYMIFFTLGLCIIMFLYYMGLFSLRPQERITVYFALFCLFMGIRNSSLEELAILKIFPQITMEYNIKIHYLTFYLSVIMSLKFLHSSFPLDFNKKLINIVCYFFAILSAIIIVTPATIYTKTLLPAQFVFLLSMLYSFVINIITVKKKRKGAIPILLGFVTVYLASINDVLLSWQVLNTTNLVSYAFLVMLFFQSYMITLRFSHAFDSVEMLSIKLDKKNIQLQDMNINLENKVKMRTDELEKEKNKLKKRNEEFENELTLTKIIQQEFIPSEAPVKNIHAFYKTMEKVGGDFYDFIHFRDSDEIGIFLSDVSGHGIPAAFITSMIKTIILQAGSRREDPAELLKYLNEILYNNTAGNFITAFYGIYNQSNKTILYANAGHNKPFIIDSNVSLLQGDRQIALATFPNELLEARNSHYSNSKEILKKGSKLLLYTDGLTETTPIDGDNFFEYSGMHDFFIEKKNLDSKSFIDSLYQELVKFRKKETFQDDICLICLNVE